MVTPSNLTIDATTGPFDVFIGWLRCMISSNLLTFRSGEKISAYHMYKQGNIGIAGHRDGFFRGLKDVHLGEYLDLYTKRGNTRYIADEIRIVPPEDVSVLAPRLRSSITLVTWYPFYFVEAPLPLHRSRLNNECNQNAGIGASAIMQQQIFSTRVSRSLSSRFLAATYR